MNQTTTNRRLFELAIAAEQKAIAFYSTLNRWFDHLPEVAAFWLDMRDDELTHLRELKATLNQIDQTVLDEVTDSEIAAKAARTGAFSLQEMFDAINNLDDAYQHAYLLESSEINALFAFVMRHFVPAAQRKHLVMTELAEHQRKIAQFPARFGEAAERIKIAARKAGV